VDSLLSKIDSPSDLKKLSVPALRVLAGELREYITQTVLVNGGHLSSNLGSVELTLALHYVFDAPRDDVLWDVGHQAYAHKIICGRRERFKRLRKNDGITGFPSVKESEYDAFTMGHSSTSLSLALGFSRAAALRGERKNVVSVIGDGAFTGGLAFEALNDAGQEGAKMIIVLNDNEMSISKNVGGVSKYFEKLRLSRGYAKFKHNLKKGVSALPFFGDKIVNALDLSKDAFKTVIKSSRMFEQMGIRYYGPFDGHDIRNLIEVFRAVKDLDGPVLVHVVTKKGSGFAAAEIDPERYHGVAPRSAAAPAPSFSDVAGQTLADIADANPDIVAITAAMCDGTGLNPYYVRHSTRYFDVGIAEQHAAAMAAGLAKKGFKPYFAVYSTFLQRAYDQILHDVCINKLPVTFLVDRAGVAGGDGVTHQGVFDLSYLSMLPDMTVCTPKDGAELRAMIEWSQSFFAPLAIRYPKAYRAEYGFCAPVESGKWEVIREGGGKVFILCAGNRALDIAIGAADAEIVNARFVKPLDTEYLSSKIPRGALVVTVEDNVKRGGFGEAVTAFFNDAGVAVKVRNLALRDEFIENLDIGEVFAQNGLTAENIKNLIKKSEKSLK
jgi:1-deoxy-D-xylulose-5-phosphate synthase